MCYSHVRKIHILSDLGPAAYLERQESISIADFQFQTNVNERLVRNADWFFDWKDWREEVFARLCERLQISSCCSRWSQFIKSSNRRNYRRRKGDLWSSVIQQVAGRALSRKPIDELRSFPHRPFFKTPVICRKAAKTSIAPSHILFSAMRQTPEFVSAPYRASLSLVFSRVTFDARACMQLLFIYYVWFGFFILDCTPMIFQPLPFCRRDENQACRELRHGIDEQSLPMKECIFVRNLASRLVHAACKLLLLEKKTKTWMQKSQRYRRLYCWQGKGDYLPSSLFKKYLRTHVPVLKSCGTRGCGCYNIEWVTNSRASTTRIERESFCFHMERNF